MVWNEEDALKYARIYNARHEKEYNENGDTIKRRNLLHEALQYYIIYYEIGSGKNQQDVGIYDDLKLLDEELYFQPTIEDIQEMKYWI